jgi:hypothetical protein
MMAKRGHVSAIECEVVCSGPAADVRLAPEAFSEYLQVINGTDKRSRKRKVHLERYFAEFCNNEPCRLPKEKFRKEESFPDGLGGSVAIWVQSSAMATVWRNFAS